MDRRGFLRAIAIAAACPACASVASAADKHAAWSYSGKGGPEHWGAVDKGNASCSIGTRQSPLDIVEPVPATLPDLKLEMRSGASEIVNNGHTIQVDMLKGSSMQVGDERYELLQFHFHRPSEHRINGKSYPMEVHFVHRNDRGTLGVCGVLMTEGAANPCFAAIAAAMPAKPGVVKAGVDALKPEQLLPAGRAYYRYAGSLTTPPCSEDVDWFLLKDTIEVSAADVAAFAKLYPMNARPVQKGFKRFVLSSG